MDNLFQLLIFLFVIYTILNSVFGKKKPQTKERRIPQESTGEVETTASPQPRYSSNDILQDLFGVKIPKSGDEYESYSTQRYPSNLETELPELDYQTEPEQSNMPDVDYDNLPSLESQQKIVTSEDYHNVYEVSSSLNQRTIELKQKIKNPTSLRELYLISEILNKPKALRK